MSQVILTVGRPSRIRIRPFWRQVTLELLQVDRSGTIQLAIGQNGSERAVQLRLGEAVDLGHRRYENLGPADDEMGPVFSTCKLAGVS